jgi:hypothetical protein
MKTSLAFRWIFSQIDVAGEKAKGEILDLFGENPQCGWASALRRPNDAAEEFCARKEIKRLEYLYGEHVL